MRDAILLVPVLVLAGACDQGTTETAQNAELSELQQALEEANAAIAQSNQSIAALEARLAAAELAIFNHDGRIYVTEGALTSVQTEVTDAVDWLATLELELAEVSTAQSTFVATADVEDLIALEPYLAVDASNNEVRLVGANLLIQNGTGSTLYQNGLGNLIVGYNETTGAFRSGSHNLVVGPFHEYLSVSGIVVGESNALHGPNSAAIAGYGNVAYTSSVVMGGFSNVADGIGSSVFGSQSSAAGDLLSVVVGGYGNITDGMWATSLGGAWQTNSGYVSTGLGGQYLLTEGSYVVNLP